VELLTDVTRTAGATGQEAGGQGPGLGQEGAGVAPGATPGRGQGPGAGAAEDVAAVLTGSAPSGWTNTAHPPGPSIA